MAKPEVTQEENTVKSAEYGKLTEMQELYCRARGNGMGKQEAAIHAGAAKSSAAVRANKWERLPKIQNRIAVLLRAATAVVNEERRVNEGREVLRTTVHDAFSRERVLTEIASIAYADPRKLFDDNKNLKHITDMDDDTAASIKSIKVRRERSSSDKDDWDEVIEVSFWPKDRALELLGKTMALFTEKVIVDETGKKSGLSAAVKEKLAQDGILTRDIEDAEVVGDATD